ncbi:MAG TPA: hypothetical protein VFW78_11165 [Bacteroidia bacterium]|nr:hypothetical protein [Bacteroidia bacterium]
MRRARKLIEYMMTDEETVDNHKEVFEGIIQAAVEQAEPVRKKNKYKKDPNNPRWNTTNNNG